MPENTILAMLRAVDLGVTTLELDVVVTADRQVICSHDPFYNHLFSSQPDGSPVQLQDEARLNIFQLSYAQTRQYDVGLRGNPLFPRQEKIQALKPLLSELIDDVEAYCKLRGHKKIFYNIETKTAPATDGINHPDPIEFVDLLLQVVEDKKVAGRTIIQSFDYRTLKRVHALRPRIRISALVESENRKGFEEIINELGFTPDILSPHYSLVNPDLIEICHQRSCKVVPWTVNDREQMVKLIGMGVDGIISDYPDLFADLRKRK